jgi:hypothetical protein
METIAVSASSGLRGEPSCSLPSALMAQGHLSISLIEIAQQSRVL